MLAHFARDVSQHIALTGQIDAKHRAWQHLRYRALGDDLRFLCHAVKCQRARKLQPTTNPSALVYAIVSTPLHRDPLKTGTHSICLGIVCFDLNRQDLKIVVKDATMLPGKTRRFRAASTKRPWSDVLLKL